MPLCDIQISNRWLTIADGKCQKGWFTNQCEALGLHLHVALAAWTCGCNLSVRSQLTRTGPLWLAGWDFVGQYLPKVADFPELPPL